jgi:2-oxoisovalerate dehydrogenase E2 component (dihydrolipoyl transacylase)
MTHTDEYDDDALSSSSYPTMPATPFLLADIGEGIAEVELLQWFVSPGDRISQFDRVCEVQSDKASVEITSRYDGVVIALCGDVGDVMLVGQPLLHMSTKSTTGAATTASSNGMDVVRDLGMGSRGDAITTNATATTSIQKTYDAHTILNNVDDEVDRLTIPMAGTNYSSGSSGTTNGTGDIGGGGGKVLTSPAVRRIGREYSINLDAVSGTGPGGRVLKADVLRIIDRHPSSSSSSSSTLQSSQPPPPPPTTTKMTTISATPAGQREEDVGKGNTIVPIRGYHRMMVKSMTSSLQVPHMVYSDEINVNALTDIRDSLRPMYAKIVANSSKKDDERRSARGSKLTYMPFFVKAASLALAEYPILNSTIDVEDMTLTFHAEHRIGIAVDTPRGLAVPVISACQDRSVLDIAEELNRLYSLVCDLLRGRHFVYLSERVSLMHSPILSICPRALLPLHYIYDQANEGNLSEADIASPTFTLSNIGAIGGTSMSPVVLPPQVAIGGELKIC